MFMIMKDISVFPQISLSQIYSFLRPKRRWEDNIRMDLKEICVIARNLVG